MSSADKHLSHFKEEIPSIPEARIGLVVSEWNEEVTGALLNGALEILAKSGIPTENIETLWVPGTFELAYGAQQLALLDFDAVICLGCVIQGETKHFDFICQAAANGIMDVGLRQNKPVIFGVLTTDNLSQAQERAGGKHGNKGSEAAYTALRMLQ